MTRHGRLDSDGDLSFSNDLYAIAQQSSIKPKTNQRKLRCFTDKTLQTCVIGLGGRRFKNDLLKSWWPWNLSEKGQCCTEPLGGQVRPSRVKQPFGLAKTPQILHRSNHCLWLWPVPAMAATRIGHYQGYASSCRISPLGRGKQF